MKTLPLPDDETVTIAADAHGVDLIFSGGVRTDDAAGLQICEQCVTH